MPATMSFEGATSLSCGTLVNPASDLASVQGSDGSLHPADRLGPGIVQQIGAEGRVLVQWVSAGFDSWLDSADLRPLGSDARLITVSKYDKRGACKGVRHKMCVRMGLSHNWKVDHLHKNVIRVLRHDGLAWTFTRNWVFNRVDVWWPQPPEDDDAEALTVAELSIK